MKDLEGIGIAEGIWSVENAVDFANPASIRNDTIFDTSGAEEGDYVVRYTLVDTPLGDCIEFVAQIFKVLPLPTANAGSDQTICGGDDATLTASGGTQYEWENGETDASITITPSIDMTLTVTVTDAQGCSATDEVSITVNQPINSTFSTATTKVCNSTESGSTTIVDLTAFIDGDISGTLTDFSDPNANIDLANLSQLDFDDVAPGNYTFNYRITATPPCPDINENFTITVENCDCPIISLPIDSIKICRADQIAIDLIETDAGAWSIVNSSDFANPAFLSTDSTQLIVENASTGTYTLRFTSNIPVLGDCTNFIDIPTLLFQNPTVELKEDIVEICLGETATLELMNLDPNDQVEWDNASTTSSINVNPSTNTNYSFSISNPISNCSSNGMATVNVIGEQPEAIDDPQDNNNCAENGAIIQLDPLANDVNVNTVTLSIIDEGIGSVSVNSDNTINYTAPSQNACKTSDLLEYEVCNIACPLLCDTGTITICLAPPGLNITITEDTNICPDESISLSASGGTGYTWSPTGSLDNANIATPTATPTETTTYTVTISDNDDCKNTASVTITIDDQSLNANTDQSLNCLSVGTVELIDVLNNDGITDYATVSVSIIEAPIIGQANIDNQQINYESNTQNECAVTDSLRYRICDVICTDICSEAMLNICLQPTGISPSAGEDVAICLGDSVTLSASGGNRYEWSPTTGLSDPTIANPIAKPSETTTYTLTAYTTDDDCSGTDEITISVDDFSPTIADVNWVTTNDCLATGISRIIDFPNLNPTDPISIELTKLPTLGTATIVNDRQINYEAATVNYCQTTDTLTAIVRNSNCPTLFDNVEVVICLTPDDLVVDLGADRVICAGESTDLDAGEGSIYRWEAANGLTATTSRMPTVNPTTTTTYTVTVEQADGCTAQGSITVLVENLSLDLGPDQSIFQGESIALAGGTGFDTYTWSPATDLDNPNIANPTATPLSTTTYSLLATSANGCTITDDIQIIIEQTCDKIDLPTAFSPNQDGMNDSFRPINQFLENFELQIFNRWGNLVYRSDNVQLGWDGTNNGTLLPLGTYVYTVSWTCEGELQQDRGSVLLMK